MRTELPLDNLRRRLRTSEQSTGLDQPSDSDDVPEVPSWVPEGKAESPSQRWFTAIRADPGRAGGIALAVIAALAVLVAVFTLIRDRPDPVVSAKLPAVEMVSTAAPRSKPESDQPLVVSVVGLVHQPGLVKLAQGSRVADAVTAAGGILQGADTIGLNLAGRVVDGQQIVVGVAAPAGQPAALGSTAQVGAVQGSTVQGGQTPGGSEKSDATGPVDLNSASAEQLDALPGVGPVTAAAIVAWRDAHGRFGSVEDLGEVDGIGPARLEKLRSLVTAG